MNLRWSWHPQSLDLFRSVDPATWAAVGQDPVRLLGEVSPERLAELAADQAFLGQLAAAHADLQSYLTTPRWYQGLSEGSAEPAASVPASIAYFSPEFGITEVLPQYSGGLGILAGDHLKAASDLGVPILGVGLLYRAGYFKQSLNAEGWQQERYPPLDPHGLPLTLVTDAGGVPVLIRIGMPEGRTLHAHVWRAQVGRVPLLLLDSDVEENAPEEREVTDKLYGGGTDHRLHQEMLLGIGGVRAIRAWTALTGDPAPEVFHTNEGHAGFLGIERIRELVEAGLSYDEAKEAVRAGTVFTTHTPVPAGIDRFPRDLISRYFGSGPGQGAAVPGLPLDRILELGVEGDASVFNMAHMGLRMAQRRNGVAQLHGIVSRGMFADLWPGFGGHRPRGRRQDLADPRAAARAAGGRGAPPAQGVVAAARLHGGRAGLDQLGVRPGRPDHRLRPPRPLLQAPHADDAGPGAAQAAAARPRPADPARHRGQGPPG
jgi:starch phosphorylase